MEGSEEDMADPVEDTGDSDAMEVLEVIVPSVVDMVIGEEEEFNCDGLMIGI
jgi:hypothetical protein